MKYNDTNRWFATLDDDTLCRMGGNGSINVTQLIPLIKYIDRGDSFLDVGCGSGTTLDALIELARTPEYKGIDFIEHRINWLKEHYPNRQILFAVGDARKINELDHSWDVVWSRHVVDHLPSFEEAINEQCRVAKKRVICILFVPLTDQDDHEIISIKEGFEDEWQNKYSRKKVKEYLDNKLGWNLVCFQENCSWDMSRDSKGNDTVIVLERINE